MGEYGIVIEPSRVCGIVQYGSEIQDRWVALLPRCVGGVRVDSI